MRATLVIIQAATFVGLAYVLARAGEPRLAAAQALLCLITVFVYA